MVKKILISLDELLEVCENFKRNEERFIGCGDDNLSEWFETHPDVSNSKFIDKASAYVIIGIMEGHFISRAENDKVSEGYYVLGDALGLNKDEIKALIDRYHPGWEHQRIRRAMTKDLFRGAIIVSENGEKEVLSKPLSHEEHLETKEPKALQIDEDWLEKKMLCVMRRAGVISQFHSIEEQRAKFLFEKCFDKSCSFCLPEQQESDHIPDVGKKVEEPREKVTLEQLENDFYKLKDLAKEYDCFIKESPFNVQFRYPKEDEYLGLLKNFVKKLEYLVSLQGK